MLVNQTYFHYVTATFDVKSIAPFDVPGALYFSGFDSEAVGGPVVRDPKFRGAAR